MEVEEDEAKVCRLCGQCESIYIDVFGDEGTKRLLGVKIYQKINILIDERDALPKAICVQCLGKLEFVCDFQEECLRTQQVLRERYVSPQSPIRQFDDLKYEGTRASTSRSKNAAASANNNNDENSNEYDINQNTPQAQKTRKATTRSNNKDTPTTTTTVARNRSQSARKVAKSQTSKSLRGNSVAASRGSVDSEESIWIANGQQTEEQNDLEIPESINSRRLRSRNNALQKKKDNKNNTQSQQQSNNTLQLPTSALNKVLSIVSNSEDIDVAVKESSKTCNGNTEDISFTVELRKKQQENTVTVLARVFPDQGSCVVDSSIVGLMENHESTEINNIVNKLMRSGAHEDNNEKFKELLESEQKYIAQNPQEFYKMDGEEIRVDDNVEQVTINGQMSYVCKLCKKSYERRDKCTIHVKTHLGIRQYACTLCKSAKFVCKSDVIKHIRCSHTNPRPIQCTKCPKRFRSKFDLAEHDNVHTGVKPYECNECGQSYYHKVSLQMHVKSHLPPQNLACEFCGKIFPFRTRLLSHVASVHKKSQRNFRCRFCYNLYSSLAVLNEHIKVRHTTTYTCETCGKTFKVSARYKAHLLQHSNPKPFVCEVCNNRYASKAFLNEHLMKHRGVRKHVCQSCGASFAQASHLAAHRHVHSEAEHACPECGKKFNRRDNMKAHRKRHYEGNKRTRTKQNSTSPVVDDDSTVDNEK